MVHRARCSPTFTRQCFAALTQEQIVARAIASTLSDMPALANADSGWRLFWSDELEVLDAALRGVSTNRGPRLG